MNVKIQRGSEALNERYGTALWPIYGAEFCGPADQRCEIVFMKMFSTPVIRLES